MAEPRYQPLTLSTLAPATGFAGAFFASPNLIKASAYALEAMTDLRFVPAATIRPDADMSTAVRQMISRGVRLLLVADDADHLVGLITARDLEGERPAEVMARESIAFEQLIVAAVMTPAAQIEVMPFEEVLHARVGDIIVTLKDSWRQHALVVETDAATGAAMVRGIFSASQIARQLGIAPHQEALAQTFADLDRAIAQTSIR